MGTRVLPRAANFAGFLKRAVRSLGGADQAAGASCTRRERTTQMLLVKD